MARRRAGGFSHLPLRALASRRSRPGPMIMDTKRLILLFIFGFSVLMLWEAWQKENRPAVTAPAVAQRDVPTPQQPSGSTKPSAATAADPGDRSAGVPQVGSPVVQGESVK